MSTLLSVEYLNLKIGEKHILKDVNFSLERGKVTGLVGESGSGKSLTALSIMQLLPEASKLSGKILLNSTDLLSHSEEEMCSLRGDDIGMVFQEPMTALNPVKTIGEQVAEGIVLHSGANKAEAFDRAEKMLARVGLPSSEFSLDRYPHELSGGQRQRVVIAIACAMKPKILLADEPTTALDVMVQKEILNLLKELVEEDDMALLLISHDLAVIAETANDIVVMRNGEVKEQGPSDALLQRQNHPYTKQLAEASLYVPVKGKWKADEHPILVKVSKLNCKYPRPRTELFKKPKPFHAVKDASFDIHSKQILGLVGASGSGKTTLSKALLGLIKPTSGAIKFEENINASNLVQAIFQDPYGSFNPRHKAERLVMEGLHLLPNLSDMEKRDRLIEAIESVGLTTQDLNKYPHEFSGGQRQRLAISRAIISNPSLIIADEPVSALDVSIRAQILNLIVELRERLNIAWLFVSHDLSVVRGLCDHVLVMKDGNIVEEGLVEQIYEHPKHAYTKQLISAAPDLSAYLKNS